MSITVYTIGHGRRSAWEVRAMLDQHGVRRLLDVRTYPTSTHNPSANRGAFEEALGGRYKWLGWALGGYKTRSVEKNWDKGLSILIEEAGEASVAVMCSESLPSACHRQTEIVPALYERLGDGVKIVHIMPDGALRTDRRQDHVRQENLFEL